MKPTGKFYSKNICSLQDFKDYCKAKGYKVERAEEVAGDGYYALLSFIFEESKPNSKDFTQINVHPTGKQKFAAINWVRLSFADCSNTHILNS